MSEIIDFQQWLADKRMERMRRSIGITSHEIALIADRTLSRHASYRAVQDFARVYEQTGLTDTLRKE